MRGGTFVSILGLGLVLGCGSDRRAAAPAVAPGDAAAAAAPAPAESPGATGTAAPADAAPATTSPPPAPADDAARRAEERARARAEAEAYVESIVGSSEPGGPSALDQAIEDASGAGGSRRAAEPRAKVRLSSIQVVTGLLSREAAARYVRRHRSRLEGCWSQVLANEPDAEGRLDVAFEIVDDGRVERLRVTPSAGAEAARTCVENVIRRIDFPSVDEETTVELTLSFSAG